MRRITALLCLSAITLTSATAIAGGYRYAGYDYGHHDDDHRGHHNRARFTVDNDRLSAVQVYVDGALVGTVAPETSERFRLDVGSHSLVVRAGDQVLFTRSVLARAGQGFEADIPAYEGRLTVVNSTGLDGRLYIDGVDRGALAAGAERTLVLPPSQGARVELRSERYVLDVGSARVLSGADTRYVADAPPIAEVRIKNPLTVPVRVTLGELPPVTVAAGDTITVDAVAVGAVPVTVRLTSGRVIETASVSVRPYKGGRIVIEGPARAAVAVHNVGSQSARIWIDGNLLASVDGYGDQVHELGVGPHQVVVRDARGNTLVNQTLVVTAFGDNELVFGAASCTMPEERGFSASVRW